MPIMSGIITVARKPVNFMHKQHIKQTVFRIINHFQKIGPPIRRRRFCSIDVFRNDC